MRAELQRALEQARTLPAEQLAAFLGELETVRITALARITTPTVEGKEDCLLDVSEAAKRMHCSRDYLYRHSHRLPFARRVGRKLLFSSNALDLYLIKAP
jgi:excisionase family DNA binding protein